MIKYRQPIVPGDRGRDVMAVKRGLRALGYRKVKLASNKAGPEFEHVIRTIQHAHKLKTDGIYGPATHRIVAPHFDAYARWLYHHARLRHRNPYVNPFAHASVQVGRVDMGVDYHGHGPIGAVGDCVVVGLGGGGWPGSHYILYRLTAGRHAGRYVYIAEAIQPKVRAGQRLKAGQTVCEFGPLAAPGCYPGIEFGWGSPVVNQTWAAATGQIGGVAHSDSPAGLAFARFLKASGAPAPQVTSGPEFPT